MKRPRVFIVHEVPGGRGFDLTPAAEYGDLIVMHSGPTQVSPDGAVASFQRHLHDFTDEDFLLPVGDPSFIAAAGAIASACNDGRFTVLRWDREIRRYIPIPIDIERHI